MHTNEGRTKDLYISNSLLLLCIHNLRFIVIESNNLVIIFIDLSASIITRWPQQE